METIHVRRSPSGAKHLGLFEFRDITIPCCLGKNGITTLKREGDRATPAGEFNLLYGFRRADRTPSLTTNLPLITLAKTDGWCDDPLDPNYNQYVQLPYKHSHEALYREDRLYDFCLVLDYNIHPRSRNTGSAIFFHQTSKEKGPTQGCVAIDPYHMRQLLPKLPKQTRMIIHA